MGYGRQFPGSASVEPPAPTVPEKVAPEPITEDDLCSSCLHSPTCSVAIAKGLVSVTGGGDGTSAISVGRCPFYLPPDGPEDVPADGTVLAESSS